MKELLKRSVTGLVFIVLIISSLLLGKYYFAVTFLVFMVLGLLEFFYLSEKIPLKIQRIPGILLAGYFYIVYFLFLNGHVSINFLFIIIPLILFVVFREMIMLRGSTFSNIAMTLWGVIYVGFPFSILSYFVFSIDSKVEYNPYPLLGMFILQWISDTGAYVAGITLGKHKLFEKLSPKKTWEGWIGGLIFTFAGAFLIFRQIGVLSLNQWIVISVIIAITGTLGDLLESAFKRNAGVKDSGNILPGHGGILDRFDSFIISSVMIFAFLHFIK